MERLEKKILKFYLYQKSFKEEQEKFESAKEAFYEMMEKSGRDSMDVNLGDLNVNVKRIQKTSVIFDGLKLHKRLPKKLSDIVVRKRRIISDYPGLVKYLKSIGADPKIFKSFIETEYSVDNSSINQLSELGEISMDDLNGCYELKRQKPFYKVSGKSESE